MPVNIPQRLSQHLQSMGFKFEEQFDLEPALRQSITVTLTGYKTHTIDARVKFNFQNVRRGDVKLSFGDLTATIGAQAFGSRDPKAIEKAFDSIRAQNSHGSYFPVPLLEAFKAIVGEFDNLQAASLIAQSPKGWSI